MFKQSQRLEKMSHSQPKVPPLIKELSEKCKEQFDTIQKLEDMEVLHEKPSFPKIIVLGEASSSSVDESVGASVIGTLVGLNLPAYGFEIPIVFKFTIDSSFKYSQKIWFEFRLENIHCEKEVSETNLLHEISKLVSPVPEDKRSSIEVTLIVIQPHVSDLTIILLPDIHTHSDKDKEKKEMELFEGYIDHYTRRDNECLFLNVLSCSLNFNSCLLSREVLKRFDYTGKHTIPVFTRVDLCSKYMITKFTCNKIESPTRFGFFFVDNTIEDDIEEKTKGCGLLSKVHKDFIGFDVISKNIVIAMWSILFKPSSLILERIESDMERSSVMIKQCQKTFDYVSDAIPTIMSIIISASTSLHYLFIAQDYGEYVNEEYMHTASNMALQFTEFRINLQDLKLDNETPFLVYEIKLLVSRNWLNPTNFLSSGIIKQLLNRQFSYASSTIDNFVSCITDYINEVVVKVLLDHGKNNLQLNQFLKEIGVVWVEGVQNRFKKKIEEMLDMEKKFLYTCSDDFTTKLNEMKSVKLDLDVGKKFTTIEGLGKHIRVDHLKSYPANQIETAFELKKLILVYWEFVVNRFVDYCALNLQYLINEMFSVGIEGLVRDHLMTSIEGKSKLPDLEPIVVFNKAILELGVSYLKEVKKDIEKWQVL